MSSKNLVICDGEAEYAKRLAGYLSGKRELALQVKLCSNPEQAEAIKREGAIDILLADERYRGVGELAGISRIIWLTEKVMAGGESAEPFIFRYQSADDIYAQIIQILAEEGAEEFWNVRRREKGKMIGIYSPVRRLGQTAFAIEKGTALAQKENVLYINLEPYAGIGGYFPEEKKRTLSMLLYYAKQETGDPGLLITTLVKQIDGMDYIPPVICSEDLKTVTGAEWMWLLKEIMNRSIYDVLILDLGDSIQGLFDILRACDVVYMPAADDRLAASKISQYEEELCRQGYGEVWERMIRCDIRRAAKNESPGTVGSVQRTLG